MDALERGHHGAQGAASRHRCWWTHLILRLKRVSLRGWLQSLFQGTRSPRWLRPDLHPGSRLSRSLRQGLSRGQAVRGGDGLLPSGKVERGSRPSLLSAPSSHAGLLAVPNGIDGSRANKCHLPSAVQPLPHGSWLQGHLQPARLGLPR